MMLMTSAARLLPQASLNHDGIAAALEGMLSREALAEMAGRARGLARPDSASRVATVCREVMNG